VTLASRRRVNRLRLGPIVGHTDDTSTRVWIRVFDDPRRYTLRIQGAGVVPFKSTEAVPEFRTGLATARGLRPDFSYRYQVLRNGRLVTGAAGRFRTMPQPGSLADLLFVAVSCNRQFFDGDWTALGEFIESSKPRFLLLTGDQIYLDDDKPNLFKEHLESRPAVRRDAIAQRYQENWGRDPVRRVLARIPTYMMWDDHEIRDGWGSSPGDSETMVERFPRGAEIFAKFNAFFYDARDVYWHFQRCRAPLPIDSSDPAIPNYIGDAPPAGQKRAMPYAFRCGRMVVLLVDPRGDRDAFRKELPTLGAEQWAFIDTVTGALAADVEQLVLVTAAPIASLDPKGQSQTLVGSRTDDVAHFKRGDLEGLLNLPGDEDFGALAQAAVGSNLSAITGRRFNIGPFKQSKILDARDQWGHKLNRDEQLRLIRTVGEARTSNRTNSNPRSVLFLSGDVHVGAIYEITSAKPRYRALSLTSSGISNFTDSSFLLSIVLDENFEVGPGVRSRLLEFVTEFNFGVVYVQPTGAAARTVPVIAHKGNSFAWGLDFTPLLDGSLLKPPGTVLRRNL
jgi:hypothetical protein